MKNKVKKVDYYGHILIISGASGVGKTTTVNLLQEMYPQTYSVIPIDMNRKLRVGEIGRRVVETATMYTKQQNGEYIGFQIVNGDVLVGTCKKDIQQALNLNKIVLMDFPLEKVIDIEKTFPNTDITVIELVPPSQEELHNRLKNDGRYKGLRVDIGVEKLKQYKRGDLVGLYDYALITETHKQKEIVEKIHQFMQIQCITPKQLSNIEKHDSIQKFLESIPSIKKNTYSTDIDKNMITRNML